MSSKYHHLTSAQRYTIDSRNGKKWCHDEEKNGKEGKTYGQNTALALERRGLPCLQSWFEQRDDSAHRR